MDKINEKIEELKNYLKEITYLQHISGLIYWDMETFIPEKAIEGRIEESGYLFSLMIKKATDPKVGQWLKYFEDKMDKLSFLDRRIVEETKRSYYELVKIPIELQEDYQKTCAKAEAYWKKAKAENNYDGFKPHLGKIIELTKEISKYKEYEGNIYNWCLDEHERGLNVDKLDEMFATLRDGIVELLNRIKESKTVVDDSFLKKEFPIDPQERFGKYALKKIGYDFGAGRLDTTVHPFTTNFGNKDVRITTNYEQPDFRSAFFSNIHEGGHGIYEQGCADELEYTGLEGGVSMGVHESQSRFYENILGRSREFWRYFYPELQKEFPEFKDIDMEDFYKGINRVEPSLIRTEADELTYSLHIIIRYELERALLNDEITIDELPQKWNEKYKEYLGIEPKNDSEGVLQDTHWASGLIGYFPSYALGNMYGAQFLNKMKKDIPDYDIQVKEGNFDVVKNWLNENIHKHGRIYTPAELIVKVTGEELTPKYFLEYLNKKYADIYNLD